MTFNQLFALEWVKLGSRRSLIYLIIYSLFAVGLSAIVFGIILFSGEVPMGESGMKGINPFGTFLTGFGEPLAITAALFFIMQSADEYKYGMMRKNIIDGMDRDDAFYAKMFFLFFSFTGWLLIFLALFIITGLFMVPDGGDFLASIDVNQVLKFLLYLFFYGTFAHFLVSLTRSSTISILILLAVIFIEPFVKLILDHYKYEGISKSLPFEVASRVGTADVVETSTLVAFLIYIVLFLGISHFLIHKRDL